MANRSVLKAQLRYAWLYTIDHYNQHQFINSSTLNADLGHFFVQHFWINLSGVGRE